MLCGLCASSLARAQDENIHWAYASYFGTGRYSLDGQVDTTIIGFSPAWAWREPEFRSRGDNSVGYKFRLAASIGAHEFSSFEFIDELSLDGINAVSLVPGVEIEIPRSERWTLKSLIYLGLGTETGGGVDAKIFRFGFRSRLAFQFDQTQMVLVNGIGRFGYSADDGTSDALNLFFTGLDFSRPLKNKKIGGDPMQIHWHVMHTNYLDTFGLDLGGATIRPGSIGSEWELGAGFGKQAGQISLWRFKLERIGLAYRFAADGEFAGVGITFRSLFDR